MQSTKQALIYQELKWVSWAALSAGGVGKLLTGIKIFSVTLVSAKATFASCVVAGALPAFAFITTSHLFARFVTTQINTWPLALLIVGTLCCSFSLSVYAVHLITQLTPLSITALALFGFLIGFASSSLKEPLDRIRPGLSNYLLVLDSVK